MVSLGPQAIYVTHFGQLRDIPRLAADLHRLIDAHAQLALQYADSGEERHANLTRGVRHRAHAQGLEAWLDSNSVGKEARFPSEKR